MLLGKEGWGCRDVLGQNQRRKTQFIRVIGIDTPLLLLVVYRARKKKTSIQKKLYCDIVEKMERREKKTISNQDKDKVRE